MAEWVEKGSIKGPKGDTGTGVPDGGAPGQLLSKTEDGTAWVDPPSTGNVLTGTATGYVAHAEDAYAQKPIEVRVKGRTVKNLWPVINTTLNGITVATDGAGLITVTGTATGSVYTSTPVNGLGVNKQYTMCVSSDVRTSVGIMVQTVKEGSGFELVSNTVGTTDTGTCPASFDSAVAAITVQKGQTVNASFRVMLVEGTEAPDCFTPPASITSVEPGNLVTAGKNLLTETLEGVAPNPLGSQFTTLIDFGMDIDFEGMVLSVTADTDLMYQNVTAALLDFLESGGTHHYLLTSAVIGSSGSMTAGMQKTVSVPNAKFRYINAYWLSSSFASFDADCRLKFQLELGSTATAYEPPTVTQTPLPEVELRSLPDGTCDELVIKADGTATVERRTQLVDGEVTALPEPTTELQSPVSLPKLPAPTFNQYHDGNIPSDTTVTYERDVTIAFDNLAKQIAGTASAVAVREASTIEEE